ncbi:MAG: hypothetical protein JRN20_06265 [Nitrososphaerota archaeon]|nr:hypothetical protein [Nitrososphaerota archaeon]
MSDSQEDVEKKESEQKKPEQQTVQPATDQPAKQVAPRVGTPIGQTPTARPQIGTPIGSQKNAASVTLSKPTVGTSASSQRPVVGTPVGTPRPAVGAPIKPQTAAATPQTQPAGVSPTPSPASRPPSRPAAPKAPVKTLRAAGPVIVLILIVAASFLGYYQVVYYPTIAPTSTTTTVASIPTTPFNVTVTIPPGAAGTGKPTSFYFQPDAITVYIGYNSTVIWVNNDSTVHTVTADGNPPDSRFSAWGPDNPSSYNNVFYPGSGQTPLSINFTFTVPGVYNYSCSYHPWMKGEVIVKTAPAGLITSTKSA